MQRKCNLWFDTQDCWGLQSVAEFYFSNNLLFSSVQKKSLLLNSLLLGCVICIFSSLMTDWLTVQTMVNKWNMSLAHYALLLYKLIINLWFIFFLIQKLGLWTQAHACDACVLIGHWAQRCKNTFYIKK